MKMKMKKFIPLFLVICSNLFSQQNEIKSIHLFDLPKEFTEKQYLNKLEKLNSFFIEAGFGKNYSLYKVEDTEITLKYKYFLVSTYKSIEDYNNKHIISDDYNKFMDDFKKEYSELIESEIYRKVILVN
jgi:hypothetical protein